MKDKESKVLKSNGINLQLYFSQLNIDESIKNENKHIYKRWYDILYRCYSDKLHARAPSYIDCEACEEWQNFHSFLNWHKKNYYEVIIDGKKSKMDLDKDILVKHNKIYSPETCIYVPHEINTLIVNGKGNRGEYPVGVWLDKEKKKYRANIGSKKLGTFNTVEQAFAVYKKEKEKKIKDMARTYKEHIPDKLYQAMVHWKIEITD